MVCAMISLMPRITQYSNRFFASVRWSRNATHCSSGRRATRALVTQTMP